MIHALTQHVKTAASRVGFTVRRQASLESQQAFIAAMQPVDTGHDLIRVGGDCDGGYLVPDDLDEIGACFSPGVDRVATFEQDMLKRGIRTFQIDASVDETPLKDPRNDFERKFLGIFTRAEYITLDDWVSQKCPGSGDLLLQMDIEGAEWLSLAATSEATLKRFRIIVIEMHYLDYALEGFGASVIQPVLDKLAVHFDVVHLHANNCAPALRGKYFEVAPLMEVTLLRKDRSKGRKPVRHLPHALDRDCVPELPAVNVPSAMYA